MCEGGLRVTVVVYTADINPFTKLEAEVMRDLADTCSGRVGGSLKLELVEEDAALRYDMTMQHRNTMRQRLEEFDVFLRVGRAASADGSRRRRG